MGFEWISGLFRKAFSVLSGYRLSKVVKYRFQPLGGSFQPGKPGAELSKWSAKPDAERAKSESGYAVVYFSETAFVPVVFVVEKGSLLLHIYIIY